MEKNRKLKNAVILLSLLCVALLAAVVLLIFPGQEPEAAVEPIQETETVQVTEPGPRLNLTVKQEKGTYQDFSKEDLGGEWEMSYSGVKDVCILLDGESLPLEQAIREGRITIQELSAWAILDHADGHCHEIFDSRNGVSEFIYRYLDFDIHVVSDVLEAPDGQLHKVDAFSISQPYTTANVGRYSFTDENGRPLTREDWGLTMEVESVTPTSLTLTIHQEGGQQIGQLETGSYFLTDMNQQKKLENSQNAVVIQANGDTTYTLDWSDTLGELPSGNYRVDFDVKDIFSEEQIDPLRKDFSIRQFYGLEFTIPET